MAGGEVLHPLAMSIEELLVLAMLVAGLVSISFWLNLLRLANSPVVIEARILDSWLSPVLATPAVHPLNGNSAVHP